MKASELLQQTESVQYEAEVAAGEDGSFTVGKDLRFSFDGFMEEGQGAAGASTGA